LKRRIATICCLFVVTLAAAVEDHPVKPPFRVSLHADCWLSPNPAGYSVTIDRASATHTRIVFEPKDGKTPATSFIVPGVLAGFETLRSDLVLTFEDPGPTTRAYSEVDGKVRQIFECASRFGATSVPIWTTYGGALVCYQGEEMVGRLWLPTVAKIYLRSEKSFDLTAEVPYRSFFQTLREVFNQETHKLSGGAWDQ
jgi:hypothetical protein